MVTKAKIKSKPNQPVKIRMKKLVKNYKLLETSWGVQTKVFFENSTLHGVRYIAENDRPFIERFLWFTCVTVGAVATIIIIVSLWEKFQTNPTITGLDTDFHNWAVPFPAITVCPEAPGNLTAIEEHLRRNENYSEIWKNYIYDFTQLTFNSIPGFVEKYENYSTNTPVIKRPTNFLLNHELLLKCEDIFDDCVWKSYNYNCCEGFFPVFTESGFCFTFNSRYYERKITKNQTTPEFDMKYIKETDMKWSLKFGVRSQEVPMKIYILNSDETAGIDFQPQHVWDFKVNRISFSVKQTYTTEDTRQLSIKQRHCAFENEINLQIYNIYTYTGCTKKCRMDTAYKLCNCIPHFYSRYRRSHTRCSTLQEFTCIANHLHEIQSVDKCACYLSCYNTVYEVEKLNENSGSEDKIEMETEFVSWPVARYKREVLFGWVDLLVAFGGIAGLFLGFSLLSGVEIIYYFTVRACCMVVRDEKELHKIQLEKQSKKVPDYDLSLVPYFFTTPLPGKGLNEVAKKNYRNNLVKYSNKKIITVQPRKIVPADTIVPPFGIEFIN